MPPLTQLPLRPLVPPLLSPGPVSPQSGLAHRVAAGLGTATSNTLPAARPQRRGSDQLPRSRRRTRTDPTGRGGAGRGRTGGGAGPGARRAYWRPILPFPPPLFASSRLFCLFSYNRSKIFNAVVKSEQFSQWIPAGRRECFMRVHSFFHSTGCGFSYSFITYYITVIFQVLLEDTGRYMIQDPEGISI